MNCSAPNVRYVPGGLSALKQWISYGNPSYQIYKVTSLKQYIYENPGDIHANSTLQIIPCGQCINCRVNKSREWATRIMLEGSMHPFNIWLTLTYDDEHLPLRDCIDFTSEHGEVELLPVICFDHLQAFNKRLREYCSRVYDHDGIRFFACGEYGECLGRCHFHVCLFNVPVRLIADADFVFRKNHHEYFNSPKIKELWGHGFAPFCELTMSNSAYTAQYTVKKLVEAGKDGMSKRRQFIADHPDLKDMLQPLPDIRFSNKPGIARPFFEAHLDELYKLDFDAGFFNANVKGVFDQRKGLQIFNTPRYFDKLFNDRCFVDFEALIDDFDPCTEQSLQLQLIKLQRSAGASRQTVQELAETDLDELAYLAIKADKQTREVLQHLMRPLVSSEDIPFE